MDSFAIYMWNMPIAGMITRVMCTEPLNGAVLIRPITVLLIMLVAFNIAKKWANKMKLKKYLGCLGIHI